MNELNVLYIGDNNYVYQAASSIYSLLENNTHFPGINVYYVNDNLSEENVDKLNSIVSKFNRNLIFIPAQSTIDFLTENNVPKYKDITYAIYQRWFALKFIDLDKGKLLYLDCDTIINGKVDEIINFDLCGKPFGMVKDGMFRFYFQKYLGVSNYYNTGVILFDVELYQKNNLMDVFAEFLRTNKKYFIYSEQDICNVLFGDKYIQTMPLKFNMTALSDVIEYNYRSMLKVKDITEEDFYLEAECREAATSAIVYHCNVYYGVRPWQKGSDSPYNEHFNKYFYKAGYSEKDKFPKPNSKTFRLKQIIKKFPKPVKSVICPLAMRAIIYCDIKKHQKK